MKIARKFTLALATGMLAVQAGSVYTRFERERLLFEQDMSRDARVLGRALGHALGQAWHAKGEKEAIEILEHATLQESHLDIRWVWLDAPFDSVDAPSLSRARLNDVFLGKPVSQRSGQEGSLLYTYVPVNVPSSRKGAIEIIDPLADERAYLRRSLKNTSWTAFVTVALFALLAWFLGDAMIGRRVWRLVAQVRAVGRGDLAARVQDNAEDELGELAREINQMSAELQQALSRLDAETTARVTAIKQLRHADRLMTVGTLASGVAHELGTPLNVIEGHAQMLREQQNAPERAEQHATIIIRQCRRMAQTIRQLLDFSRRGSPRGSSADAHAVVRETVYMLSPLLNREGIEAIVEDETSGESTVAIASNQLQQVITNIGVNAIHAMPNGGRLEFRLRTEHMSHPQTKVTRQFTSIAVNDEGAGMTPEAVDRVFEPFFTTKDVGEGTGLGLSVAYGIIEDHHGWIKVESRIGKGSTFTVYVPTEKDPS